MYMVLANAEEVHVGEKFTAGVGQISVLFKRKTELRHLFRFQYVRNCNSCNVLSSIAKRP